MIDVQLQAYNDNYGTQYFSVIPTNVYGLNDNYSLDNSHVVPAIIHKVYLAKQNNEDLICWGSGGPLREFIFAKDVANITQYLLENYKSTQPVIISNSIQISIKELVEAVCDIMDFKKQIIWNTDYPDGQFKKPTDNSHLMKVVPGCTFTPLRDGLEQTIDYFTKNYDQLRK
jgi:GDP-L-fucose synthase